MIEITTNNHWHDFLHGFELPKGVLLSDFDYLHDPELLELYKVDEDAALRRDENIGMHNFIKYHGVYYNAAEFMPTADNDCETYTVTSARFYKGTFYPEGIKKGHFSDWHGYMSDSFFSGVVVRYSEDFEQYQIATYCD